MHHRHTAQSSVEYGLIVAALTIAVLLGAGVWGQTLERWLLLLIERITAHT